MKKLHYIPINDKKVPQVPNWQTSTEQHRLEGYYGVGLVCGKLSDNIEAIDLDLKYDITGTLFRRYKLLISETCPGLLDKMTVVRTVSKGYHFIYRCSTIDGNKKLANRSTTDQEKQATYNETFLATKDSEKAKRAAENDKVRVLLETRGEGGYIATIPTPGYELVYGKLETIQEITPEEREVLLTCAQSFNELVAEFKPEKHEKKQVKGQSPFEDYNSRGDVISLLEKHGWTALKTKGSKTLLKRPGQTSSAHSGNFDHDKNWFSVFSTSTEFQPEHAYQPYAVYAVLECKGDFKEASKKLYDEGYGERKETALRLNNSTPSRINELDDDYSFLAGPKDWEEYLHQWRTNTFQKGLSTGMPDLDKYFLFKKNNLVVINGIDNVGKSTVIWFLALISNIMHGWKWIIFSSENSVGSVMRKLIEFYWCEPIDTMNDIKYRIAKKHIQENFSLINCDDELYNYRDILAMTKKLLKLRQYQGLMIDPYNSLKMDLPKGLTTHDYHYEAISEIKLFTKRNNISVYVNCHVVTNATRTAPGQNTVQPPKKGDTEGGGKFANKADDFLTIHRDVGDPMSWKLTQIHVRKIKETETGGKVTPWDAPVLITAEPRLAGFKSVTGNINPVIEYHKFNHPYQEELDGFKDIPESKPAVEVKPPQLQVNNDFLKQTNIETDRPPIVLDDGTKPPF